MVSSQNVTEAPSIGRRERSRQDRRATIVRVAQDAFLEHGYAATSMSALSETLGGSKSTLWRYFRSKEELLGAVVENAFMAFRDEIAVLLRPQDDLDAGLIRFCGTFMTTIESPMAIAFSRLIWSESGRVPTIGHIFYDYGPKAVETGLTGFVAHHIGGRLRHEDPRLMAMMLISLCKGRQNRMIWGTELSTPQDIAADAVRFTGLFLRAYGLPLGD